jgi:general secretion pathway protein A
VFLDFYNLREQPFGVTPDPRFLYFSPGHREALASLFYGIETGRGFLSLIAGPGMGKTTLLFQLLKRWKDYMHSAFVFQTQCNSRELLRYLLEDLGLDSLERDIVRMHSELNDFLFRETNAGKKVVVFIDESQNLSDHVLETVRLLSDFEAPERKMLQIVLAGQPELALRLSQPGLAQLRQRISIQARLEPLTPGEVIRYINHRLQTAGYQGPGLFTPGALALIAERTRGTPRLINNVCFNSLSIGCASRSEKIDAGIVRESAMDLSLDSKPVKPSVTQPIPTPRLAPHLHPKIASPFWAQFQSLCSWIKTSLFRERLPQTSAVALLLTAVAAYVGVRSGASTAQPPTAIHQETASASTIQGPALPHPSPESYSLAQPNTNRQLPESGNSSKSFVYVVQPNDTLHDLCVSTMGRYDRTVVAEIQKLNPELNNFDHLQVGQRIRFPVNATK